MLSHSRGLVGVVENENHSKQTSKEDDSKSWLGLLMGDVLFSFASLGIQDFIAVKEKRKKKYIDLLQDPVG